MYVGFLFSNPVFKNKTSTLKLIKSIETFRPFIISRNRIFANIIFQYCTTYAKTVANEHRRLNVKFEKEGETKRLSQKNGGPSSIEYSM